MNIAFRPLPMWPHTATPSHARRSRWTFKAGWQNTMDLLERELRHLSASNVIIAAGFREGDIRRDGLPRSDARAPSHPGVEISFDTQHGRLVYGTDVCDYWQHNVRSIALGLQSLRAVDRYGITRRGEQYAGWRELPSGVAVGPSMSIEDAADFILSACEENGHEVTTPRDMLDGLQQGYTDGLIGAYRTAAKYLHPDAGGNTEDFRTLQEAKRLLEEFAS